LEYEGDGTMVILLAWSHVVDEMILWDIYSDQKLELLWIQGMLHEEAAIYLNEAESHSVPRDWDRACYSRWLGLFEPPHVSRLGLPVIPC